MHKKVSVNALCFMGTPFRELAEIWRELDAYRVSLIGRHLLDEGLAAAQTALATGDYQVETIAYGFLMGHLEPREESWREPRASLSRVIEYAAALKAKSIYMVTGGHGAMTWEEAAECFGVAIAPCIPEAKDAGVALMIENAPPVYANNHLAHSFRDAVTLAEMAGIRVCMDLIATWTEAGLQDTIKRAAPRLELIQVGDYVYGDRTMPARAVPGDGNIPIKRICEWALDAGYKGAFDLELLGPRIDREGRVAAVRRAAQYVSEMLESLGA
jgi:sugar phosphate isomerase/epimerase